MFDLFSVAPVLRPPARRHKPRNGPCSNRLNVPDQRPGATDFRHAIDASSPGSLNLAGWAVSSARSASSAPSTKLASQPIASPFPANRLLKNPPGEGAGPTRRVGSRGNPVGRVPSRGVRRFFQQPAKAVAGGGSNVGGPNPRLESHRRQRKRCRWSG